MAEPSQPPDFKVLILKNFKSGSASDALTIQSFTENIRATVPNAHVNVCSVADAEALPDTNPYDLVILSGGTVNLLLDDKPKWVVDVLEMVRRVASDDSKTKILGICWGHQAVHYALGGDLGWLKGPLIGVQQIQLTPTGERFFGGPSLLLHKYHLRYVSVPAPDFTLLAPGQEITRSWSGKVLTFQGHPELTAEISQALSQRNKVDGTYQKTVQSAAVEDSALRDVSAPHDGKEAWAVIMKWAIDPTEKWENGN